jgi:hypothetical protein
MAVAVGCHPGMPAVTAMTSEGSAAVATATATAATATATAATATASVHGCLRIPVVPGHCRNRSHLQ